MARQNTCLDELLGKRKIALIRISRALSCGFDPNSEIAFGHIGQVNRSNRLLLQLVLGLETAFIFVYLRSACYNLIHILTYHKPLRLMQKLNSILLFCEGTSKLVGLRFACTVIFSTSVYIPTIAFDSSCLFSLFRWCFFSTVSCAPYNRQDMPCSFGNLHT